MAKIRWLFSFCLILLATGCTKSRPVAVEYWREASFEDFRDGTFGDGGANTYVSARGRIQTVNRWDANGDGYIDIPFSNSHPDATHLDASIYWGDGRDYSVLRRTSLMTHASPFATAADLDADGAMDLVLANPGETSFIYYGNPKTEEAFARRVALPTRGAVRAAIGDLNRDGQLDIVFAESAGGYKEPDAEKGYESPSRIYWGAPAGFDATRFTDLPGDGAMDVAIADLNSDGWPEVVFANRGPKPLEEAEARNSYIYWGGANGFGADRRTELATLGASAVASGDVNQDGRPDLVFANEKGDVSYAYLNQNGAFDIEHRLTFRTHAARDCVIADFNQDPYADVFFSNHALGDSRLTDSFLYYGGSDGFAESRCQRLPTIGAWGASAADLNGDGWTDLLVSSFQSYYDYDVPSFIYWNSPQGFERTRRTPLYERGAAGNAAADLDGDGHLDLLIMSQVGLSHSRTPKYVYWGNRAGRYSPKRRLELPGNEAYEHAMGDLNDDGCTEIIFANLGELTRPAWWEGAASELQIYWNRDNTFDSSRVTGLPTYGGNGAQLADLDRDGYIDIIASNFHTYSGTMEPGSFIYWGEPGGFTINRRTALSMSYTRACAIADLNRDGHLDLVFGGEGFRGKGDRLCSIFWGNGTRDYGDRHCTRIDGTQDSSQPEIADLNRDGWLDLVLACNTSGRKGRIYYGGPDGSFNSDRMTELDTARVKAITIADVDRDGWLDIVCPFYQGESGYNANSRIFLGGPQGFAGGKVIELPTQGGTGSIVSDFNFDGYPDIFFYCHHRDRDFSQPGGSGDHLIDSWLYWGGADGFKPTRRLGVPGCGPHFDFGVDLGDIYNRRFSFDYVSSPYHYAARRPLHISWKAEQPHRSRVIFQVRVADTREGLAQAPWLGPRGPRSFHTRPRSPLGHLPDGQWMQYRAVLNTENGAYSPTLSAVEIAFTRR